MTLPYVMRKKGACFFFLIAFLTVSCSPPCYQWKLAIIKANCPPANYVKIYLPACNTFNGLEAALMSCNGSRRFYLYALTLLFPCNPGDEEHSEVSFSINEEGFQFSADRLQGGQCLLLPEEAMQLIVESLLEKKCVEINVGRYKTTLIPDNFHKVYETLLAN